MNKIVVLNQKTYMNLDEFKEYIKVFKDKVRTDIDVVFCPSSIYLPYCSGRYNFSLGSQNLSYIDVTGEVTSEQLKSMNVRYSIIGHGERRVCLNESFYDINKKIISSLNNGIIPIICLGETKEEYNMKKTQDVIVKQMKAYLKDVEVMDDLIFAYEPIWAINTGVNISLSFIDEIVNLIKNIIYKKYGKNVKVLYGGSINEKNIDILKESKYIDGFMIGKLSSSVTDTLNILNKLD